MFYLIGPNNVIKVFVDAESECIYHTYNIEEELENRLRNRSVRIITADDLPESIRTNHNSFFDIEGIVRYEVTTHEQYQNNLPKLNMSREDNLILQNLQPSALGTEITYSKMIVSSGMAGWYYDIDDEGYVHEIPRYP